MTKHRTRGFLLRALSAGLLGWGLSAAAQGVDTFENNGVIQQLDPVGEQIVIDGRYYTLPTAVAQQARDQRGTKITLQRGMRVSFYGSTSSHIPKIQGINFLRWSDR
ncbi:MAG: PilY2 family type 4a fimbrial biogenesis protein [Nitrococcus mobilis]|nr:PilY2 family type 4a fimbrial biogenesis protein [Nitrococcus mobilis]